VPHLGPRQHCGEETLFFCQQKEICIQNGNTDFVWALINGKFKRLYNVIQQLPKAKVLFLLVCLFVSFFPSFPLSFFIINKYY